MASLKDMRVRISSVKATQKITKAMQMVAAAKLRRSQDAAQNARPYASRMAAVIANLASGVSGDGAPLLLAGTGSSKRHLVIVAAADRGLAGGFSSSIVRAARERIATLLAEGKDVKIITVGKKALPPLRRLYGDRIIESFDLSAARTLTLSVAQPIADRDHRALRGRRGRRGHPVLQPLQVGGQPDPGRPAADPGARSRAARRHRSRAARSMNTSPRRGHPRDPAAAQHHGAGALRPARESWPASTPAR